MVTHSITRDGTQSPAPKGGRLVAFAIGVLVLPPLILAGGLSFTWDVGGAAVAGAITFASLAVAVIAILGVRAHSLADSRDRLLRLERAMATSSAALLKRGVADPVGTALLALVEGVDASSVFLDSVGDKEADQGGTITTVRDVLRTTPSGEPAGWDLMPWRVSSETRRLLEAGRACEVRPTELDEQSAAMYRVAQIGSEIVIPISVEGVWVGNVGFSSKQTNRIWTEGERQLLVVGAEMIGVYWERRDALGRLQELVAAKDEFIASVSHEVRTPLTAVLGFAHELHESSHKFSDAERDDLIALMAVQSQEVANIVDDLLIAARAETGSIVIAPERVSVRSIVGEVLSSHSGRVDFSMAVDEDLEVWADPVRTRQVLRNLLTNADRYGGSTVKVHVDGRVGDIAIEVRDNGDGVPQGLRDHVFEPYARAHDGRTQPASVGLGLSVARKLSQLMKGDLVLARDEGWTVFTVTLPRPTSTGPPDPVAGVATGSERLAVKV